MGWTEQRIAVFVFCHDRRRARERGTGKRWGYFIKVQTLMPFIAQLFILSGLLACLRKWTGMAAEEKERERMVKK